jgi:1,2-diacylglycerol 3-alpha-glucosyltransferase
MTRLGVVGVWTNARGAGIVNQRLYQALVELGHDVFVFGRPALVSARVLLDQPGPCAPDHFRGHPRYEMDPNTVRSWAQFHQLEIVLFGEEHQFELPMVLQRAGIRTMQWIDAYLASAWRPLLKFYDQLWCITHRAEQVLREWGKQAQTAYIGWGVPPELWPDLETLGPPHYDLMHSAGWLGLDARKGTDTLLAALSMLQMRDDQPMADAPLQLLLHSQMREADMKEVLGYRDGFPPHVIYVEDDVPPPGLYHLGRVVVQPSKVEGIGLSIPEAMCVGRPVITVDTPPMSEFVTPETGWLLPIAGWKPHIDGSLYAQAVIDPAALAICLREACLASAETIRHKSASTYLRARMLFHWGSFKQRLGLALEAIAP